MAVVKVVPLKKTGKFAFAIAEYDKGRRHIIVKSSSYIILRDGIPSSLIDEKDMEVLKKLPDNPVEALKKGVFISSNQISVPLNKKQEEVK